MTTDPFDENAPRKTSFKVAIIGIEELAETFEAEKLKVILCDLVNEVHRDEKFCYLIPYKEWGDCIFNLLSINNDIITYEYLGTVS